MESVGLDCGIFFCLFFFFNIEIHIILLLILKVINNFQVGISNETERARSPALIGRGH